jgi:hypothetical protein
MKGGIDRRTEMTKLYTRFYLTTRVKNIFEN